MTSRDFCYWLQGYLEISKANPATESGLTLEQTTVMQNHLNLVFVHEIDPQEPGDPAVSQAVHDGQKPPLATGHRPGWHDTMRLR